MSAVHSFWAGPTRRLRTWLGGLSLSFIFHVLCITLLVTELLFVWLFLFKSFDTYYGYSREQLAQTSKTIVGVFAEPDIAAMLETPWAMADVAPLGLTRLNSYPLLGEKPYEAWDDFRLCRRVFKVEKLQKIDVCAGVLAPARRWGPDFETSGKYLYLTIVLTGAPPVADDQANWRDQDHIEVDVIRDGRVRDRIVIVHLKGQRVGSSIRASMFRLDTAAGKMLNCRRTAATLKPSGRTALCGHPRKAVSVFTCAA